MVDPTPDLFGLGFPAHAVIEGASREKGYGGESKNPQRDATAPSLESAFAQFGLRRYGKKRGSACRGHGGGEQVYKGLVLTFLGLARYLSPLLL